MSISEESDVSKSVGRIVMLSFIENFEGSKSFLKKIISSNKKIRIGITDVCMANMANENYRDRCENVLMRLLDNWMEDVDESVTWHFHQSDPKDFKLYYPVLRKISTHIKERRDLHFVMEYLSKCVVEFPHECINIMINLVQNQSENLAYNLTTDEAVNVVTSAYMKASTEKYKEKAMDIVDMMYQKGYYKVRQLISALDR
jgi:hypothetical protein